MKIYNLSLLGQFGIFIPLLCLLFLSSFTTNRKVQYVAIPDAQFERTLIFLGIDSDGIINGLVKRQDILTVDYLDLSNKQIMDVSGIEDFTSLTDLDVSKNEIQRMNLSSLKKLEKLDCSSNALLYLDVSKTSKFKKFNFMNNPDTMKITWN